MQHDLLHAVYVIVLKNSHGNSLDIVTKLTQHTQLVIQYAECKTQYIMRLTLSHSDMGEVVHKKGGLSDAYSKQKMFILP